jgi:thioesterase domain-containing protein/non-ribosomal peptide synthetase component F
VIERIATRALLPLQWCDLRSLDAAEQAEEVTRLSLEHARQALPLNTAPLIRAGMLQLGDTEHILVWNAHHSVCDGWSVGLLASDLMACYGELLAGTEPAAPTSLDYGDYAVWLDAQRKTPEYEAHRTYWKQQLQGLQLQALPDAWRATAAMAKVSTIQSVLLPRSLTEMISGVAQRHHSTFFHAVLAGFGLLLRTQQSKSDVVLETPLSGRDQSELESVVGTFVNYLPLRFGVDADMRFSGLLHEVRDLVTDSFEHAQFRYEDMLEDLEKEGNGAASRNLPAPVAFICQQDFVRPITAGGVALTAVPSVSPGALRPLTVFMVERADGWRLSCEVDNDLVSHEAGSRLLEDFQRLLKVIAAGGEDLASQIVMRGGLQPIPATLDNNASGFDAAGASLREPVRIQATEFQRRFWRLDTLNPGGVAFHVRIRLQLKGPLQADALQRAVASVARRNEILRTTLEEENDQVWQVIHPELPIDFRLLVSEVQGPDGLRSKAQRLADQAFIDREGQEGFSLANGPLFRVRVLRLEDDRHWLAVTLSHGIVDGWSTGIFLEQLQQAYEQEVGSGSTNKTSPVQFSVHAATERKLLGSPEKDRRLAWWQTYLGGVWTPLDLPQDIEGIGADGGDARAGLVTELLDSETMALARRFARECQATAFAVFGGIFQALLSRYSGQSEVFFLTPHANRSGNSETIMGPLADPICLTGHIGPETTFRELVTRFGAESMDAMEQALPLNLVTPLVDMRVGRHYHPLNQITFFYQRAFVHDMAWKGLEIDSLPDVPAVTGSEWQLGVVERKSGVFLEFLYDATLYSEATIQIVQRHFARLLREAVLAPDVALSQLKLMTAEEMEKYSTAVPALPVIDRLMPRRQTVAPAAADVEQDIAAAGIQAPVSQNERDMMRLWRQILKIEDLDVNSNFFDLGGHSLLLARLQIVMKREFNVQLTAADVFRHPTIGTLAAWLDNSRLEAGTIQDVAGSIAHNPRIIPIQPRGTGHPIFVISQSMIFRTLAAELGLDQPVYAIQTLEQDNAAMATATYEQLIDFYVQLIREVQPSGPYRLAGWCVSGWIAYGVARRLEQLGQSIELAMIIDAWAPAYWNSQSPLRRRLMLAIYHFQRFRWSGNRPRKIGEATPGTFVERSRQAVAVAIGKLGMRLQRWAVPAEIREMEDDRLSQHVQATARLAAKSGPLQGNALLFRSQEEPTGPMLAVDMGWSELFCKPVDVEVMPGDHHEIFDLPGARMMALRARAVLGLEKPASTEKLIAAARRDQVASSHRSTVPRVVS